MQRPVIIALVAVFVMMLAAWVLRPVPGASEVADASASQSASPFSSSDDGDAEGQTVIKRDGSGQFHLTAQANGQDTRFLVDTGADMVALTVEDAEALDLGVDPAQFEPIGQTASGVGYGMQVQLETLEVGGNEFRNVDAIVIDGLTTNLLGQSVLRRLGKVELRGDEMVIRHGR